MNRNKIIQILIICLVVSTILPLVFYIRGKITGNEVHLVQAALGTMFTFLITGSISIANLSTMAYLQNKFPWDKFMLKRIVYELLITSFNATVLIVLLSFVFYLLFGLESMKIESLGVLIFDNILTALVVNIVVMSIVEGIYLFRQWRVTQLQVERLKRESVEAQLSVLKNQVNPHFLFNSLNTLSSIIPCSPDKAVEFVNKFSKIFRYVLDIKEETVIKLGDELEFINSYYFLQKIRFGEALTLTVNVEAGKLNDYIPPLSIQILVENALKHNEVSDAFPLEILIYSEADMLIIKNKIRKKESDVQSTGLGLKNLTDRYNHFTTAKPSFYMKNDEYIAKIPILKDDE